MAHTYISLNKTDSDIIKESLKSCCYDNNEIYFNDKIYEILLSKYFKELHILFDDNYLSEINLFNKETKEFIGACSKSAFAENLFNNEECLKSKKIYNLDQKLNTIKNSVYFKNLNSDEYYLIKEDGVYNKIYNHQIYNFIVNGHKHLEDLDLYPKKINKNLFLHIVKIYAKNNEILKKYCFEEEIKIFINDILDSKLISKDSKKYKKGNDEAFDKFDLNEDLENLVLSDMPSDYTTLQKVIYIYIKLAKILTYAPDYALNGQSGLQTLDYTRYSRLSEISPTNNQIVCFEFSQIYAKFLKKLGINYTINQWMGLYGYGHAYLNFEYGKLKFSVDAINSIFNSDLYNAKVNNELEGLKVVSGSTLEKVNFIDSFYDIYDYINEKEGSLFKETLDSWLDVYTKMTSLQCVKKEEKQEVLVNALKNCNLAKNDKASYLMDLINLIYFEEASQNKIKYSVCSEKTLKENKIHNKSSLNLEKEYLFIIAFNDFSFNKRPEMTKYKILDLDGNIKDVLKEDLKNRFKIGQTKPFSKNTKDTFIEKYINKEG